LTLQVKHIYRQPLVITRLKIGWRVNALRKSCYHFPWWYDFCD